MADTDVLEYDDGEGRVSMSNSSMNGAGRHRSRSPIRKSRSRSRSPREWRRGERNRSHDRERGPRRGVREDNRGKVRLYVCNMPYDVNWQYLKDLFKKEIGAAITYVEMYTSPDGKSCGAGVVEIKGKEMAEKAIDKFDRFDMKGRKIVVREEREKDRMRHMGGDSSRDMGDMRGGGMGGGNYGGNSSGGMNMGGQNMMSGCNTHGISPSVLQQLNIDPKHVTNQVFIANLDYKVTAKKLREVFKMAGTVVDVDLKEDQDGKSRGMAVVKYEHPVESVQAISMFNQQVLFDRAMTVKMDKLGDSSYAPQQIPNKLPSGLQGIGMGLGSGGVPVNMQQFGNMNNMGSMMPPNQGMMTGNMGNMNPMPAPMNAGMNSSNMAMPSMNPMSTPTTMNTMMTGMSGMNTGMPSQGMGMTTNMPNMSMGDMSMTSPMGSMGGGMSTDLGMTNSMQTMSSTMTSPMGGSMDRTNYGSSPNMGAPIPSRTGGSMGGSGNGGMGMEQTSVFVRNLPFSMSWQDLKQRFTQCGDVKFAEIKMDNGRSKGFGTVKFHNEADAQRAINMFNGTRIDGRTIEVRLNRI